MQIKDIIQVQPLLLTAIDQAIKYAVRDVTRHTANPQEPDFVASLTINFSWDLFHILKALFPNNRFSVTGVFCHQKPLVDIRLARAPEIGDLLLVYIHTDTNRKKTFNSILFQAKVSQKRVLSVAPADAHQLELYEQWPDFTYRRAGKLNGTTRSILPKAITDGAQYLLIDNHPVMGLAGHTGTFPMGTATPNRTLALNNNLATEIVEFLKIKSGRSFEEDPNVTNDDWTKMIWDLLDITKGVKSRRRNYLPNDFDRQQLHLMNGFTTNFADPFFSGIDFANASGNETIDWIPQKEEDDGISVLLIESNDQWEEDREEY